MARLARWILVVYLVGSGLLGLAQAIAARQILTIESAFQILFPCLLIGAGVLLILRNKHSVSILIGRLILGGCLIALEAITGSLKFISTPAFPSTVGGVLFSCLIVAIAYQCGKKT